MEQRISYWEDIVLYFEVINEVKIGEYEYQVKVNGIKNGADEELVIDYCNPMVATAMVRRLSDFIGIK
jgi:hypothetical protein